MQKTRGEITGEGFMRIFRSSDEIEDWMTMCNELDFLCRAPEKR